MPTFLEAKVEELVDRVSPLATIAHSLYLIDANKNSWTSLVNVEHLNREDMSYIKADDGA